MSLAANESVVQTANIAHPESLVPVLGGSTRLINLDHAASTPALRSVQATVTRFLDYYSSVHRGTGFTSQISTRAYEEAREIVGQFVGARPEQHVVIFGANTTWALNKLARRIRFNPGDVVITSELEHHANDLPWRQVAKVVHIQVDEEGKLDESHFASLLRRYAGKVRLVTVSGGSNVTGVLPPIHRLAVLAHAAGAEIAVDCAQLAPHRPIDIGDLNDPSHIDYIAFSGHKLYAPFGAGVLVGRRDTFAAGTPDTVGGGTVEVVTEDSVTWADTPARDEPGSPNVVGAVALAAATRELQALGFEQIVAHETSLIAHALRRLTAIDGVILYGDRNPEQAHERLGVLTFRISGVDHRLTAAILSHEYGIAVRAGAFCAQPYVRRLLDQADADVNCSSDERAAGMVRVSVGLTTTLADIDVLADAVETIARGNYRGTYRYNTEEGVYQPTDWEPQLDDYFTLR